MIKVYITMVRARTTLQWRVSSYSGLRIFFGPHKPTNQSSKVQWPVWKLADHRLKIIDWVQICTTVGRTSDRPRTQVALATSDVDRSDLTGTQGCRRDYLWAAGVSRHSWRQRVSKQLLTLASKLRQYHPPKGPPAVPLGYP